MSEDKIAEIRERYAGYSLNSGNAGKANEDRGWLLAEVERLRAENDRLREVLRDIARTDYTEDPFCELTPEGLVRWRARHER